MSWDAQSDNMGDACFPAHPLEIRPWFTRSSEHAFFSYLQESMAFFRVSYSADSL